MNKTTSAKAQAQAQAQAQAKEKNNTFLNWARRLIHTCIWQTIPVPFHGNILNYKIYSLAWHGKCPPNHGTEMLAVLCHSTPS
jgi:hypothetical protein